MIYRKFMINTNLGCKCKNCDFYPYFHYVNEAQLKFYPELKNSEKFDIEFRSQIEGGEVINHTTGDIYKQSRLGEKWVKQTT